MKVSQFITRLSANTAPQTCNQALPPPLNFAP
jgi:hypothetical protein